MPLKKILIVDDEDSIREILKHLIAPHFKIEILEAISGNSAIEILNSPQDIELVICDYRMPDGNGGTVYEFIKEKELLIPFLMMSTDPPEIYSVFTGFYEENSKNGFLKKPFRKDTLINFLEKILNK
jgi:DNA-binding NtrC family response regulator